MSCLFLTLCSPNLHSNEYFQDILNRIVITVMFSMISPLQAANLVYGCANILGMDLLQELPQRTLIITGMRKTNDLKRGHDFIIRAFKPFGKIEEAAIAPSNRGFGKLQSQYISMNIVFTPINLCISYALFS